MEVSYLRNSTLELFPLPSPHVVFHETLLNPLPLKVPYFILTVLGNF